jgi:hypothetical protein
VQENCTKVENVMFAIADGKSANKVVAHWAQKLANSKL